MKKNYIIPAIETLDVRSTFAICEGSPGNGNVTGGPSGDPDAAPKRRVLY